MQITKLLKIRVAIVEAIFVVTSLWLYSSNVKVLYGTFGQDKKRDVAARFASKKASWPSEKGHVRL